VSPTPDITAAFSKKIMASSINAITFFKKGSPTKLEAAVSYSAATDKATLNPTNFRERKLSLGKAKGNEGAKGEGIGKKGRASLVS
jgi:hypothetical protein